MVNSKPPPPDIMRKLSVISRRLMVQKPFYGFFMMTLNRIITKSIPTAGVRLNRINYELSINPTFWETLSSEEAIGVFQHEILHIIFNHITTYKNFEDPKLFNIAADLYINSQIIKESGTKFLPGATRSKEQYEKFITPKIEAIKQDLKDGKLTKEEAKEKMTALPIRGCFAEDFDLTIDKCISMGTKKIYDFLYKENENGNKKVKSAVTAQGSGGDDNIDPDAPWSHKDWEEITKDLDDTTKELIQKQVEYQLKSIVQDNDLKSRGLIPGYMKNIIDELFKKRPPVTNWKALLRRFFSASLDRYTKKTRRKESKRIPGMPGLRVKSKQRILLLIDTSASVSNGEIIEGRNEIFHIQKLGFKVDVCEVDTAIGTESIYEFKGKFRPFVTGRGGTQFDPGVQYMNDNAKKYSCGIYITDGECSPSKIKPRIPLLWLLTSKGDDIPKFKSRGHEGPVIKINTSYD